MTLRIPSRALVVLAGPSGAGKSSWAQRWFRSNQIVAADDLRAVVGRDEHDQRFDSVSSPDDVAIVPGQFARAAVDAARQADAPLPLSFGLQILAFDWPGENADIAARLGDVAAEAEEAGFTSLWLMDHFVQIPQVGRDWDPMLESYTTLGYLAARTSTLRLGTLVSGVTYRNIAHLGKVVATLDVLSGGRAVCGLGAAWFEREHTAYGCPFPPVSERYELLEDALQLLPLLWGPGSPPFDGRHISTPEALCYPRPLQEHLPILVGGSGERRTLRLVAQFADACNLFGDPDTVRRKVEVLHQHCADVGRDPAEVSITQLSTALCSPSRSELGHRVQQLAVGAESPEDAALRLSAGTPEDHIGRYRLLAEAGVQHAVVSLADVGHAGSVRAFSEVIEAFDH